MENIFEMSGEENAAIRRFVAEEAAGLRVALPGTVAAVNWERQTVSVRLGLREKVNVGGALEWEEIPVLPDVPFVLPRAGGYLLTLPVKPGDECLVIFADMCIDAWWQQGGVQNQIERRRHDLSDGFAILAPWSQPKRIANYSRTAAQLRNESGGAYIELDGDNITIKGDKVRMLADNFTVDATTYTVNSQQSAYNGSGNTVIEGRNFLDHAHNGVQSGPGNTGGVV
jgi:hypothetical protein